MFQNSTTIDNEKVNLLTTPCLSTTILLIKLIRISTWIPSASSRRTSASSNTLTAIHILSSSGSSCTSTSSGTKVCSSATVSHHSTLHTTHHHLAVHTSSSTLLHLGASHGSRICSSGTSTRHSISTVGVVHTSSHAHVLLCHSTVGTQVHTGIRIVTSSSHTTHGRVHSSHLVWEATRHFVICTCTTSGGTCTARNSLSTSLTCSTSRKTTVRRRFKSFTSHFSFLSSVVGLHVFLVTFGIFRCHLRVLGKAIGINIFPTLTDEFAHFFKADFPTLFFESYHHTVVDEVLRIGVILNLVRVFGEDNF
mmetsp:Transcript_23941/g.33600  ORF Transcript_23941/g.33600 Transcript_23941/m.33600 type:complete len:308 (-) Transcript_23941:1735-2658(-)